MRLVHDRTTTPRRAGRLASLAALAVLAMLGLAACGGGGQGTAGVSETGTATGAGSGAVVKTADTDAGTILVDSTGRAIYMFDADSGGKSACTGACLSSWPIVPAPDSLPATVTGVTAKLGVLDRPDGSRQLTVDDRPVYTYAGDTKAGMTSGQGNTGFGAPWWVLSPDGTPITEKGSVPSTGGGYGGGAY